MKRYAIQIVARPLKDMPKGKHYRCRDFCGNAFRNAVRTTGNPVRDRDLVIELFASFSLWLFGEKRERCGKKKLE